MTAARYVRTSGLLAAFLLLGACGSDPVAPSSTRPAAGAAGVAASMVGKPYRYGGSTPQGFDCSGLVYYSYRSAGLLVPRSTTALRAGSRKVASANMSHGDLLFFSQDGKFSSHVGIYLGRNRFVHAPSSGKRVRIDSFNDPYWQKHFVDARRL